MNTGEFENSDSPCSRAVRAMLSIKLRNPRSKIAINIISFHYILITFAQTLIGESSLTWTSRGANFTAQHIKELLKYYHFSMLFKDKEADTSLAELIIGLILSMAQILIILNFVMRLIANEIWIQRIGELLSSRYLIWVNYLLAPITFDIFLGSIINRRAPNTQYPELEIIAMNLMLIALPLLIINIVLSLIGSTLRYYELRQGRFNLKRNSYTELLIFLTWIIRLSLMINGPAAWIILKSILIVSLNFGACYCAVYGPTMTVYHARNTYSLGFILSCFCNICSLVGPLSHYRYVSSIEVFFAGTLLIIISNLISSEKFKIELLYSDLRECKTSEEASCRLINLSMLFKHHLKSRRDEIEFRGFIEVHLITCTKIACPLIQKFRFISSIKMNPVEYSKVMNKVFIDYLISEFLNAMKLFPNSPRIRIEYSELLFTLAKKPQSALDILEGCRRLNTGFIDYLSYLMQKNKILEQSVDYNVNKDLEGREEKERKRISLENSKSNEFDNLLKRSVNSIGAFWQLLSAENPEIHRVYSSWIKASEIQNEVYLFWKTTKKLLETRFSLLYHYGTYLRTLTNQREEGLAFLTSSKEKFTSELQKKYKLENIQSPIDLSNHAEGMAILINHRNKWIISRCNQAFAHALGFQKELILNSSFLKFIPKSLNDYYLSKIEGLADNTRRISSIEVPMLKRFVDLRMYSLEMKVIENLNQNKSFIVKIHSIQRISSVVYFTIGASGGIYDASECTPCLFPSYLEKSDEKNIEVSKILDNDVAEKFETVLISFWKSKVKNSKGSLRYSFNESQKLLI